MRKNAVVKMIAMIIAIAVVCICAFTFVACNDTRNFSKEIFVRDFSDTYTISLNVNVRHHTYWPNSYNVFEYKKGIDNLYDEIWNECHVAYMRNDTIVVDVSDGNRYYSCMIYPSGEKNKYIIHSMTYTLGEWADNQAIFFPGYWLDKEISSNDGADTVYQCAYKIEALASYYRERGYYAEIEGNTLKVVCLLKYPSVFPGEVGEYGHRAISWSVVFESENTVRFADVSSDYPKINAQA